MPSMDGADQPAAAAFNELGQATGGSGNATLDALLDVSLPVTIEFGRTEMAVQEVLELTVGSVIQLERMVGEPVDILVGDRKLGEGEVVVIGEYFGVRINRVVSSNTAGSVAA
jgi:flagellar motor switch protein FliN/FliY